MRYATGIGCVIAFGALIASSGCRTVPEQPLPPAPRLLTSAPLQLPDGCEAKGSYLVHFAVHPDGGTADIQPPAAAACVQTALAAWVASFRYAPQAGATPMAIEWLMVEAKKGG